MRKYPSISRLLLLSLLVAGCGETTPGAEPAPDGSTLPDGSAPLSDGSAPDGSQPNTKAGSFESDLPGSSTGTSPRPSGGLAGSAESAPNADSKASTSSGAAARAISEADVIQTAGDRLYALSRVAGLTVIDISDPAKLSILGRYRELNGQPFEMYLRDGVVLAMYSSWGQYVKKGDDYQYVQTSKVVAIDVANPAAITAIGTFDVAGEVSDSRIVGDVMYVVGYQNGSCWNCEINKPQTSILSLNVSDVRAVQKVDELTFADATNSYGWSRRSVTVTDRRMYVAGPEWGQEPKGSTIQVVDISDPAGDLKLGASVPAAGQISSRWQMDEHQGVLRVISQVPTWTRDTVNKPLMQTFTVASSETVTPLATAAITIPPNETLNTVRFDGPRGYAITSERTDPLFTLDFSDPAKPRQIGELEMPGWVYHLVPRGDRVIGLGYDHGNPEGAITVSVFDVSNFAAPKMLDRVNFGGDWANLPEDQDRIHKAFRILDDQKLMLVPFSGWSTVNRSQPYCYSSYNSGIQLVDLVGDDLILRGAAPARGQARRALLHKDKLLAVSDEAVDSYDIANRAQPVQVGRLTIARNVSRALPLANQVVARINEDWNGRQNSTIDFIDTARLDRPDFSLGEVSLSEVLAGNDACHGYSYIEHAFARGNQVVVSYQRYTYDSVRNQQTRGLVVIDASDPAKPAIVGRLEHTETRRDFESTWQPFYGYYSYSYSPLQQNTLLTDHGVALLEQRYRSTNGSSANYETRLRFIDLRNPADLKESVLLLPKADGYSGLVADGPNVMVSHFEKVALGVGAPVAGSRARFFVDRIDLSNPAAPTLAAKVNVPGSLLHFDRANQRILTSDLLKTVVENITPQQCYERFGFAEFTYPTNVHEMPNVTLGTCTGYRQKLHLARFVPDGAALEETLELAERDRISSSSMGDGRVVAVVSHGYGGYYGRGLVDCFRCGYGVGATEPVEILTLGGFTTGDLTAGRLSVENSGENGWWGFWGTPPVYAFGTRALVNSQNDALVLDVSDVTAPKVLRKVPLYATAQHVAASGNTVLLALGMNGVQRIDL